MHLFRIVLQSAWLSMRLSTFSLCFISVAALRCFEGIRLFEGLFCLARAKTRLRLFFAASFLFLLCFVYLFRTSLILGIFFRSFSFCLFAPLVPQCHSSYEISAVDSFHASVS